MRIRAALVLLPLVLASASPNVAAHRRHHARLVERQGGGAAALSANQQQPSPSGGDSDTGAPTPSGGGGSSGSPVDPTPSASPTDKETSKPPVSPPASPTADSSSAVGQSSAAPDSSSVDTDVASTPTSASSEASVAPASSASSAAAQPVTSATPTPVSEASDTATRARTTSLVSGSRTIVTTATRSASASASAASAKDDNESSGLPKGALIAIIVCAVVLGVGLIAWTLFRKWKLRPSKNFDQRMQPIDFSPNNTGTDMGDDFFEKTMARDADAERQRQQYVAELDKDASLVGDLQHDFTAGPATGAYYGAEYGHSHGHDFSTPRNDWEYNDAAAGGYPPAGGAGVGAGVGAGAAFYGDYPTQDNYAAGDGYADLQRGPSSGANYHPDLQRGPSVGHAPSMPEPFNPLGGSDFAVSGRPTDGSGGAADPYAQAATYRY